jgi:BirA family biotin operon repressor/biotin-[acetyl-CoA-carboxylase] ligase
MNHLDATRIRDALPATTASKLLTLEVLAEIDSTNSFLQRQGGPPVGETCVAVTENQTAGRGRHGRTWQSPPGSGLCLSLSYTFAAAPGDLPALTLATGIGVVECLSGFGFTGVQLKWPNDLVALDGKLGGILTEAEMRSTGPVTVVTGLGLNIDVGERTDFVAEADRVSRIVDLRSLAEDLPSRNRLTAGLIARLLEVFAEYETAGFQNFRRRWPEHDWLYGRELSVERPGGPVTGVGAGIAPDGALLVDTRDEGTQAVSSGSVTVGMSK